MSQHVRWLRCRCRHYIYVTVTFPHFYLFYLLRKRLVSTITKIFMNFNLKSFDFRLYSFFQNVFHLTRFSILHYTTSSNLLYNFRGWEARRDPLVISNNNSRRSNQELNSKCHSNKRQRHLADYSAASRVSGFNNSQPNLRSLVKIKASNSNKTECNTKEYRKSYRTWWWVAARLCRTTNNNNNQAPTTPRRQIWCKNWMKLPLPVVISYRKAKNLYLWNSD